MSGFHYQSRHTLRDAIPSKLGSISLGYSYANKSLKVYYTKKFGQQSKFTDGMIDLDLSKFIEMWRHAISQHHFTPELVTFFQHLTDELLPGFKFNIASFYWFLRPHFKKMKIGFSLMGINSVNILSDIMKLKQLSKKWSGSHPIINNYAARRFVLNVPNIGDIECRLFMAFYSSTNCMIVLKIRFLFNPRRLDSKSIDLLNLNTSRKKVETSDDVNNKPNILDVNVLQQGHCKYRLQFVTLWIIFVSSVLFKKYETNLSVMTSKL